MWGKHMQDTHEFLLMLFQKLSEEETSTRPEEKVKADPATASGYWAQYRKTNRSMVDFLFSGLVRNTVMCKKCKFKSVSY